MDRKVLETAKNEIIGWFRNDYLGQDGFPVSIYKGPAPAYNLLPDLGDYLPFLFWCGEDDYVRRQIGLARDFFQKGRFIFLEDRIARQDLSLAHRLRLLILGKSVINFDYSDLLLGLVECYEICKDEKLLGFIEDTVEALEDMFSIDGVLSATYYPKVDYRIPLARSTNGIFLELYCDIFRFSGDKKYLKMAEREADFWLKTDFFEKYGLFPHIGCINESCLKGIWGYGNMEQTAFLAKDNTATAAGILALYRITKKPELEQALNKWLEGVLRYLILDSGAVCSGVKIHHNTPAEYGLTLKAYALIEFLCDYFWVTKNAIALKVAEKTARFYMALQSPQTGLLPDGERQNESYFDSETDFGVSLMKLYEITRSNEYRDAALRILQGQIMYHRVKGGYANRVNIFTREVTDDTIETRYVSLFLKLILLFLEEKDSYQDLTFYSLLRDR